MSRTAPHFGAVNTVEKKPLKLKYKTRPRTKYYKKAMNTFKGKRNQNTETSLQMVVWELEKKKSLNNYKKEFDQYMKGII